MVLLLYYGLRMACKDPPCQGSEPFFLYCQRLDPFLGAGKMKLPNIQHSEWLHCIAKSF